ncbi:inositol 1,4,5-trisphosphate receptor-interacting protein-like 1 [Lagopus leucura]|uniref:inositol 1,4,5-trisphosphate receptor-interacting protein-like 1 n=1 Tax=Lagopus leucura TaxID=30410 RepID=UPI001C67F703|nr:inositol 1,4,5-trisphosphate receptor-interacting protein-like 1 [Lagopus leucura]
MAFVLILALLVRALCDNAVMLEGVQQQEVNLREQMTQLQHETEQWNVEQRWVDVPALLFTLLNYWRIWFCMGLFFLLFWNMWQSEKMNQHHDSSSEEDSFSSKEEAAGAEQKEEEQEKQVEQVEQVEKVEQEKKVEQKEKLEQEEKVKQEEKVEQEEQEQQDEVDFYRIPWTRFIAERALLKAQGRPSRCQLVEELMSDLLLACRFVWSNSFYPTLRSAIGVGSAFEGWSPREEDTVYRLLVPVEAPRGHIFHLELYDEEDELARNPRVRVELKCMCEREQQLGDVLCFLHHPVEDLVQNQDPSLLQTLCTDAYLDVEKIVTWFRVQVATIWNTTLQADAYNLKVLPSRRSCKLQLTNTSSGEKILVELLFGVQQGNSDIFLSSQNTEAGFTPSTTWPQSCAVAEMKYFQYLLKKAGENSVIQSCLRFLAHTLVGMGFSNYVLKTLVFHLVNIIPLGNWQRRNFLSRLESILQYLHFCLKYKRLVHFFIGNKMMPDEVILPHSFRTATPVNLFQHLEDDPDAESRALRDFRVLRDRLLRLLLFGR